jgi:hypothetical protein
MNDARPRNATTASDIPECLKMKKFTNILQYGALACGLLAANPGGASASLIYDSTIHLTAQGFGNAPRDLTVQATGNSTSPAGTESGCVSVPFAGGPSSCLASDAVVFMGNGVLNLGGDEPSPLSDNQKYGVPFESDLGITTAADLGILFNATEPGGDSINIADLTLKFYLNGILLGAIDGQQNFPSTFPGNGVAGFVFTVDADQQAIVNSWLSQGNIQFALESTLTDSAGGPDTFRIVNLNSVTPIPEPATMMLLASGLLLGVRRLRRRH